MYLLSMIVRRFLSYIILWRYKNNAFRAPKGNAIFYCTFLSLNIFVTYILWSRVLISISCSFSLNIGWSFLRRCPREGFWISPLLVFSKFSFCPMTISCLTWFWDKQVGFILNHLDSVSYVLCDLGQFTYPLWTSVSSPVRLLKW